MKTYQEVIDQLATSKARSVLRGGYGTVQGAETIAWIYGVHVTTVHEDIRIAYDDAFKKVSR